MNNIDADPALNNPASQTVRAYIGLGSNLENPINQVRNALLELQDLPQSRLIAQSSLYVSDPLGPHDQPDYINAVAALDTQLSPQALLQGLQDIETQHRRIRSQQKWGPRSLDLDLLLYGDLELSDDILTVPHPGISQRNFVLYPLLEVAPDLNIATLGAVKTLVDNSSDKGLRRLSC